MAIKPDFDHTNPTAPLVLKDTKTGEVVARYSDEFAALEGLIVHSTVDRASSGAENDNLDIRESIPDAWKIPEGVFEQNLSLPMRITPSDLARFWPEGNYNQK